MPVPIDRYHRQSLLPQFGSAGQERLRRSRVLLLGVGALGSTLAESLVRAGVGAITLVDRDIVELTNLQRQTLFDESDARAGLPKVEAAARRLRAINGDVAIAPHALDVDASNLESLLRLREARVNLILDGSDNAELRYLINDVSVRHGIPWVMGGVIGVEGRVCAFAPAAERPCLRCVFPTSPSPGELATCDTAGVLGPAVGMIASLQAAEAIKLLLGDAAAAAQLISADVWASRFRTIDVREAKRADCPCCGHKRFDFLDRPASGGAKLCGRNAMQVRLPLDSPRVDLAALSKRLQPIAAVAATELMLKVSLNERPDLPMNVFGDGRMIIFGTTDPAVARSMYARVVGV